MIGVTTPREVSKEILVLCRELVSKSQPRFLEVRPTSNTDPGDCFPAVARHAEAHGGSVCYGWLIWEWPGVFVEAEFHAVWRDPEGKLHDITHAPEGISRILFLPDPAKIYEGRQVNNVRRALSDNSAITEFFQACDAGFELMNRGSRADKHGKIALSGADAGEWQVIERRKAEAYAEILRSLPPPGRNNPCPCGSGKKYKRCHGA